MSNLSDAGVKHQRRGVSIAPAVNNYRWEKEILATATNELVPMHGHSPSLSATTFAEVPALPAQPFKQAEIIASIRVGKAKVDLYSGADASVVKALCQALKSC